MNAPIPSSTVDWSTVVAQHEPALVRYATKLLGESAQAQDVVQDTFLRMHEHAPALDGEPLRKWLFRVCRNRAIDVMRREGRWRSFDVPPDEPVPPQGEEVRAAREVLDQIEEELPVKRAQVVRLRLRDGCTYEEISDQTGLTVNHVGVILHGAVRQLRRRWVVASAIVALVVAGALAHQPEAANRATTFTGPLMTTLDSLEMPPEDPPISEPPAPVPAPTVVDKPTVVKRPGPVKKAPPPRVRPPSPKPSLDLPNAYAE